MFFIDIDLEPLRVRSYIKKIIIMIIFDILIYYPDSALKYGEINKY